MHLKSYDWAEWFCCPKVAKIGKTIRANLVHLPYKCSNHLLHHENVDPFGVLEATSCFLLDHRIFLSLLWRRWRYHVSIVFMAQQIARTVFLWNRCLLVKSTVPTNKQQKPANRSSQKEIACSSHPFSGANCYFQGGYALSLHKR